MIHVGVDLVTVSRIVRLVERHPSCQRLSRVFTWAELQECFATAISEDSIDISQINMASWRTLAGKYAAKEAVAKALGTGFSQGITPSSIVISKGLGQRPNVCLSGETEVYAKRSGNYQISLSISHEYDQAVAFTVLSYADGGV